MVKEEIDNPFFCKQLNNCVSVIIPTLNSADTLARCLDSIILQSYANIEIIVIDGHSSDNTREIASKFNATIFLMTGQRTSAKNYGISKSSGDFLLFVDSDMILQPAVISECVSLCSSDRSIIGIVIPERTIGDNFWAKVRDFERTLYLGSKIESARFFRKSFVVQVGGFDEEIIFYEESTLPQKLEMRGMKVNMRTSSVILHNEEQFNLTKWLRKKHYYSSNAALYVSKYPLYARIQTTVSHRLRIILRRCNWRKLIKHPTLSVGLLLLKTLEFFASRI